MFDIGFTEVILISVIGLLVLGPERLPRVARTIGLYFRKARQTFHSVRSEIEKELAAEDMKKTLLKPGEIRSEMDQISQELNKSIDVQAEKNEEKPVD